MAYWQTHRFRDCVALSSGSGSTVYMTEGEARSMAAGLLKAADSCVAEPFHKSGGNTSTGASIDMEAENRHLPVMERNGDGRAIRYMERR